MKTLAPVDVVIIGGGWTGLLMAKELSARSPVSIVVLERGRSRIPEYTNGMDELDYFVRMHMMQDPSREAVTVRHHERENSLPIRNYGAFHEACTVAIGKKLVSVLQPRWLRIGGYFHPRGGMPIDVFWQAGKLPAGTWVPDQGVSTYRAR